MSNSCDNDVFFFSEDKEAVRQLFDDLTLIQKNKALYGQTKVADVVEFYDGDPRNFDHRGSMDYVSFDEKKNAVFVYFETAWGPNEGLFNFIASHYNGMRYVYSSIGINDGIYINVDRSRRFFPQRYILDDEDEGMLLFNNAKELLKEFNKMTGTHFRSVKAAAQYAREFNETHNKYLAIHKFER